MSIVTTSTPSSTRSSRQCAPSHIHDGRPRSSVQPRNKISTRHITAKTSLAKPASVRLFGGLWRQRPEEQLYSLELRHLASAIAAPNSIRASHAPLLPTKPLTFTVALDVGAPGAVASPMAQPNAEPVEDYECVDTLPCRRSTKGTYCEERWCADIICSYESLPPNFSLLQNMAAGAFAGIAEHCASKCSRIRLNFRNFADPVRLVWSDADLM